MKPKLLAAGLGLVAVIISWYGWYRFNLLPAGTDKTVKFTIDSGTSVDLIAKQLEDGGVIRNRQAFVSYLTLHGLRFRIQAGSYTLSPARSAIAVAGILVRGQVDRLQLVIPEGTTNRKLLEIASNAGIDKTKLRQALSQTYNYPFLQNKPAGVDLEGYLFPDSYQLQENQDPVKLVNEMLTNFGRRLDAKTIGLLSLQGLNLHEAVTLASIVEKEVANQSDRSMVAGVFLNRLKIKMPLESDVTVQYATDLHGLPFNLSFDSPYNTYKYPGLPVGPICNPGLSSVSAVAAPTKSDYLYFLAGKDGKTYFAKTFAQHERNIQLYLR